MRMRSDAIRIRSARTPTQYLAARLIRGRHCGTNIGQLLARIIGSLNLSRKLGWAVSDNCTTNDTTLAQLAKMLNNSGISWDAKAR